MLFLLLAFLPGLAATAFLIDEFSDDSSKEDKDDVITQDTSEASEEEEPDAEEPEDEADDGTSFLGFQIDDTSSSVSLSAEDVAALADADIEDLTYYDSETFTFEIEAGAAGDEYLHLVNRDFTSTEEGEDGSSIETTHHIAMLVLSDSEEVPDASQISFDENGELLTDGIDPIAAAYNGFTEYVDGRFNDYDPHVSIQASVVDHSDITSVFGEPSTNVIITDAEDDIGLPISEDGSTATINLTAEDLSHYSTTDVPLDVESFATLHINDSADLDELLSNDIETLNIEIPEGFDVVEVNVTHGLDEGNLGDYAETRAYYVLVEEGTTLDAEDITIHDFIDSGYYQQNGDDRISIDSGDYGFILGVYTGSQSMTWDRDEQEYYIETSTSTLEVVLTGNVTAPSQVIDLTTTF